jgi:hypothetical protein
MTESRFDPQEDAFNHVERMSRVKQENVKAQMSNFNKPTNPPAFPNAHYHNVSGMTLRDYFAARAMQALIDNDGLFSEIPTQAYELADAMLKARES